MEKNFEQIKSCSDCGKPLKFNEFCQYNPSLQIEHAKELYYSPTISIYCPRCYFERPERPFKLKRRTFTYFNRKFKS